MTWWSALALAGSLFAAAVPPATAAEGPPCDLEALRHYPVAEVLRLRAHRLWWTFGPQADRAGFELYEKGAAERRTALDAALVSFSPPERTILWLAVIGHLTSAPDSLTGFFATPESAFLTEVLETLDAEGLAAHAALLRQARALFGRDYGTYRERAVHLTDAQGQARDQALERSLAELSLRYGALPPLLDLAAEGIARSPELAATYDRLRTTASEEDRFVFLHRSLDSCYRRYGKGEEGVADFVAQLPKPYALTFAVSGFDSLLLTDTVGGFFSRSLGDIAPEVVEGLRAMGLEGQAAAVQRGIDLFPKPYPRDRVRRLEVMEGQGVAFTSALDELTAYVDDGAMGEPGDSSPRVLRDAAISFAQKHDILPRVD